MWSFCWIQRSLLSLERRRVLNRRHRWVLKYINKFCIRGLLLNWRLIYRFRFLRRLTWIWNSILGFVSRWSVTRMWDIGKWFRMVCTMFCFFSTLLIRTYRLRIHSWSFSWRHSHHWHRLISWTVFWLDSFNKIMSQRPLIIDDVLRSSSFIIIYLKARDNKMFIIVSNLNIRLKEFLDGCSCDFFKQNALDLLLPR